MMTLDRQSTRIIRCSKTSPDPEQEDGGYMPGSMAERLAAVWEITQDAWAFVPDSHVKRRLQRHIALLTKSKG